MPTDVELTERQKKIFEIVEANPGVSCFTAARLSGIAASNVIKVLHELITLELVSRVHHDARGHKREYQYFPSFGDYRLEKDPFPVACDLEGVDFSNVERAGRVFSTVRIDPGVTLPKIASRIGASLDETRVLVRLMIARGDLRFETETVTSEYGLKYEIKHFYIREK